MKRLLARAVCAGLVWLALAGPSRADLVNWTFSTTPVIPNPVLADGGSPASSITLGSQTNFPATGATNIVLASLTATSGASPGTPDKFTSSPWSTLLTITDTPSGLSKTLTVSGVFNGTMSTGSSIINGTFTSGPMTFQLGQDTYVVTPDSIVGPNIVNASNTGGIGASVSVSTPEPSSLLLCGLGAAGCALARWRKRSRSRRPVHLAAC